MSNDKLSRKEVEHAADEPEDRFDHPFRRRLARALLLAWDALEGVRDDCNAECPCSRCNLASHCKILQALPRED